MPRLSWQGAKENDEITPEENKEMNDAISAKPEKPVVNKKKPSVNKKKEPKGTTIGYRPTISTEGTIEQLAAEAGMSKGEFVGKSVNMMLFFVNKAKEAKAAGAKDNDDISAPLVWFLPENFQE
ncbi:hypothetical protein PP304_gp136 [Gordonia phage Phendrix]|uniref:Helix-turn-helix DNA binding domain protein n=1 Tax=Gordonia phage Phendrix TaxID=2593335 RepID=A0A514U0T1_9CAUD|nr:helix-turn-helix DNA-binding domain protein [Gordonia phage Phendrix]YP_010649231.1 hypothetical protein PP304_gp136 [Gordonia phage Phendrix]QDK02549.1 helix-turn-helix DNA-binding domain protein [Gordonia phage Phendrix]QDK02733.1 hypothetical protein SEA_PHENDRIX_217 [Gordonia phage Phendrix]